MDEIKGEPIPSAAELYKSTNLKPDVELAWCSTACFDNTALFLVRDEWLTRDDLSNLSKVDPHYEALVISIPALANVDFSSLKHERLDYSSQKEISSERVMKLTACAIHFGFNFGLVVRYINDKITAKQGIQSVWKTTLGPTSTPLIWPR